MDGEYEYEEEVKKMEAHLRTNHHCIKGETMERRGRDPERVRRPLLQSDAQGKRSEVWGNQDSDNHL